MNDHGFLKKLIVLRLFFHFLLAFHRQFVLLFLNEEFFKRTTRAGQDFKIARAADVKSRCEDWLERSVQPA
jgi:hypothetical protein